MWFFDRWFTDCSAVSAVRLQNNQNNSLRSRSRCLSKPYSEWIQYEAAAAAAIASHKACRKLNTSKKKAHRQILLVQKKKILLCSSQCYKSWGSFANKIVKPSIVNVRSTVVVM